MVNCLCGFFMQVLYDVVCMIMIGDVSVCLIGGVEYMGYVLMSYGVDFYLGFSCNVVKVVGMMGLIVEMLVCLYGISCEMQDQFVVCFYVCVWVVIQFGVFKVEIIFIGGYDVDGVFKFFNYDEVICLEIIVEMLFMFKLVFDLVIGMVMVGIFFVFFDGVVVMLLMSESCVCELGLKLCVCVCLMVVVGCDLFIMGYGLVLVLKLVLKKVGLFISNIDVFEMNEVFVVQILLCIKDLGLMEQIDEKINFNGGVIVFGYLLGCFGVCISIMLINQMECKDVQFGFVIMCIGLG